MRVGEIKNIIQDAVDENGQLVIYSEPLYGGQAYRVRDYSRLVETLELLRDMEWNTLDFTEVQEVIDHHSKKVSIVQLTDSEFSYLNSYVSQLNAKLPIYFDVIKSMVKRQGEQFINIKLPGEIDSFADLNNINGNLGRLFKEFSIDGGVEFVGFDKGSDWYTIELIGAATYAVFIACLKIGQEIMKLRKEYYGSETAKVEYETAKEIFNQTKDVPSLEEFQDKKLDKLIDSKVAEAVSKLDNTGAKDKPELTNQLVIATKDLVEQMGDGVEFHLSLNPPEYAHETAGSLTIDYKKINELNPAPEKSTKQIAAPKKETKNESDTTN